MKKIIRVTELLKLTFKIPYLLKNRLQKLMNSQYDPQFSINKDQEYILFLCIHLANDTLSVGTENKIDTMKVFLSH